MPLEKKSVAARLWGWSSVVGDEGKRLGMGKQKKKNKNRSWPPNLQVVLI